MRRGWNDFPIYSCNPLRVLLLSLSSLYKTYCYSSGSRGGYAQDRGCEKGRISHNVRVTHPAHHAPLASLLFESPFLPRIETEATPENLLALNRPCGGITHLLSLSLSSPSSSSPSRYIFLAPLAFLSRSVSHSRSLLARRLAHASYVYIMILIESNTWPPSPAVAPVAAGCLSVLRGRPGPHKRVRGIRGVQQPRVHDRT